MGTQQQLNQQETQGPLSGFVSNVISDIERQEKKEELDKRLKQLRNRMFSFAEKYGINDYRTQLMIQLHDVGLVIRDSVELIDATTVAMSYMFEAVTFFDDVMQYQQDLLLSSTEKKYGLFQWIKNKILERKAKKNLVNRMKTITNRMAMIQDISQMIVVTLSETTGRMQKKIQKNNEKNRKKHPNFQPGKSESLQMVQDYLDRISPDSDKTTGSIAPTKSSSSAFSSANSDDDFKDI